MPSRSALNQVSLERPGTASYLMPNAGTAHEWITSSAEMSTRTVAPTGTTAELSTVRSRGCPAFRSESWTMIESNWKLPLSGYWYDQYHWWPVTLSVMS